VLRPRAQLSQHVRTAINGPQVDGMLPAAALAVSAGFALWCTVGRTRA
jgi:hypothetical protein